MKRFIASLATASLFISSPGPLATQALAQAFASSAGASAPAVPAATTGGAAARGQGTIGGMALPLSRNSLSASLELQNTAALRASLALPVSAFQAAAAASYAAFPERSQTAYARGVPAGEAAREPSAPARAEEPFRERVAALAQQSKPLIESLAKPEASDASLRRGGELLAELLTGAAAPRRPAGDFTVRSGPMGALSGLSQAKDAGAGAGAQSLPLAPVPAPSRRAPAIFRSLANAAASLGTLALTGILALALTLAAPRTAAAQFFRTPPGAQAPAPAAAAQKPPAPEPLPMPRAAPAKAPISAAVAVSPQNVTIGHTMQLSITVRNDSDKPLAIPNLRSAIEKGLLETRALELDGPAGKEDIRLEPGQSRTIVLDVLPTDAPLKPKEIRAGATAEIRLKGVTIVIPAPPGGAQTELTLPEAVFRVRTVLDESWSKQGRPNFRDIYEVQRGEDYTLSWVAGALVGILLLIAAERLLAARRSYKRNLLRRKSLLETTNQAIGALETEGAGLSSAQFYDRFWKILSEFLMDFHGLRDRVRSGAELIEDIQGSGKYSPDAVASARALSDAASAARFGGREFGPEERAQHLSALRSLVAIVAGPQEAEAPAEQPPAAPPPEGGNALLMGAALLGVGGFSGLSFGSPAALLLIVPLAAYVLWKVLQPLIWRSARGGAGSVAISSTATLPKAKSLRQRLMWIPGALGIVTVLATLLAIAGPEYGVQYKITTQKTVDSYLQSDVSGSMGSQIQSEDGGQTTALAASLAAMRDFTIVQRRGTTNRVAIGEFADTTYTYVRLSNDYDAIIAVTREMEFHGSTAIGEAILTGVRHFLEANAYDLVYNQRDRDERLTQVLSLFDQKKFSEGLKYLRQYPDLMEKVLQPSHNKIIVLFSDGGHNTGLAPLPPTQPNAAEIARDLGVRVYTVGINTSGNDEQMLKDIAKVTGAWRSEESPGYYKVGDAKGMQAAVASINALEKAEISVNTRSAKDFQLELLLLALAALGLETILSSTKLRTMSGAVLLLSVPFAALPQGPPAPAPPARVLIVPAGAPRAANPQPFVDSLTRREMPKSLEEANALYVSGRYVDAVKAYARALEEHPDVAEIYFNMANAYLRLGDFDRAQRNYQEYIRRMSELEKGAAGAEEKGHAVEQQAMALYNQGNMALMQRDLEKAIDFYKKALRTLRTSPTARWDDPNDLHNRIPWNLEVAQRLRDQSEQQGGQGRPQRGQQGGQQGNQGNQSGQGNQQGNQGNQGDQNGQGNQQGNDGSQGNQPGNNGQGSGERQRQGLDALQQGSEQSEQAAQNSRRQATPRRGNPNAWGIAALPLATVAFGHPSLLWLLTLLPVLALILYNAVLKNIKAAKRVNPLLAAPSFGTWKGRWSWLGRTALTLAAAAGIVIAASQPFSGQAEKLLSFGGKEILPVLDSSLSMEAAEDHRMDHAEAALASVGSRMEGTDRYGLVVFRAKPRTASPLSTDTANFVYKVRRARYEADGLQHGSDIAAAITHAITKTIGNAKKIGDRKRILILISDGDIPNEQREPLNKALELARKESVAVYTIGMGNAEGTKMVVPTLDGKGTEYVVDERTGQPAVTKLNAAVLEEIADRTGGRYFPAGDGSAIEQIWLEIAKLQQGRESEIILVPNPLAPYFLWPAVLFLFLRRLLPGHSMFSKDEGKKT